MEGTEHCDGLGTAASACGAMNDDVAAISAVSPMTGAYTLIFNGSPFVTSLFGGMTRGPAQHGPPADRDHSAESCRCCWLKATIGARESAFRARR
jgi:hypothetical protein